MAKFDEAEARLFRNKVVCRKCKSSMRATSMQVLQGKVKCRQCNNKTLRPMRKK